MCGREEREGKWTYRCEFRWCRDMFKWTDTIIYLTNTFFMFLTVQFRVHLIHKRRHFFNLNKHQDLFLHVTRQSRLAVDNCLSDKDRSISTDRRDYQPIGLHSKPCAWENGTQRLHLESSVRFLLTISCRSVRCWLSWLLFFWMASSKSL